MRDKIKNMVDFWALRGMKSHNTKIHYDKFGNEYIEDTDWWTWRFIVSEIVYCLLFPIKKINYLIGRGK